MRKRLLVFNCHEAWVHQLDGLGFGLDIIIGLSGRYTETWDTRMRPLPSGARLLRLEDALKASEPYACIVTHNITDLMDVKTLAGPRIYVIHTSLEGRLAQEGSDTPPEKARSLLRRYLQLVRGHAVAVSRLKGETWGMTEDIVPFGANPDDYPAYSGELAAGLRISNLFHKRRRILMADFHERTFADMPVRLVGHNPDMPGVEAAGSWAELKELLRVHRFYIHTADPRYEDGYNMATLEAMAAGMPVLGNRHPTSPVEHGVSGFLSDDAKELAGYARRLLADRELAVRMGQAARKTVMERFHISGFLKGFRRSIRRAQEKWRAGEKSARSLRHGQVRRSRGMSCHE